METKKRANSKRRPICAVFSFPDTLKLLIFSLLDSGERLHTMRSYDLERYRKGI